MNRRTLAAPALALAFTLTAVAAAPAAAVRLDAAQARRIGLQVAPVQAASATPLVSLPGVTVPRPQGRVAVSAPFPGVVRQTLVIEGQSVSRGQRLAVVQSREVLQIGAELARARARLGVARAAADRARTLAQEGIVSGARAEQAAADLREAEVEVNEKSRVLQLARADAAGGSYTLTAPIAGRVVRVAAQTGAAIDGLEAPFVIDAPGPADVEAQLPARFVGQVRPGMAVQVAGGAVGRVVAVGSNIDAATRSATLRASLSGGPPLPSGRTVSLVVLTAPAAGAVQVPSAAVVQLGGASVVFEQTPQGFVTRPVRVIGQAGGRATVTGLRPGVRIAVSGTSELKSLAAGG